MTTFMTVYRGETAENAELIAVTVDKRIIALAITALLERDARVLKDPVLIALDSARREALQQTLEALRD